MGVRGKDSVYYSIQRGSILTVLIDFPQHLRITQERAILIPKGCEPLSLAGATYNLAVWVSLGFCRCYRASSWAISTGGGGFKLVCWLKTILPIVFVIAMDLFSLVHQTNVLLEDLAYPLATVFNLPHLPPHFPTLVYSFLFFFFLHLVVSPLLSARLFPETYGNLQTRRAVNNWYVVTLLSVVPWLDTVTC